MISSTFQVRLMGLVFLGFCGAFALSSAGYTMATAAMIGSMFPVQVLLWRFSYTRNLKDFFFGASFVLIVLILQQFWEYADTLFYISAILIAAVSRYGVFAGITGTSMGLDLLRNSYYRIESIEDMALRYLLFWVAGSLTFLLLREEKRQKEEIKKELDHLKYGIHQVEEIPEGGLSVDEQTSRSVDAAMELDESIQHILNLVHSIFKPRTSILWQYLSEVRQLRVRNIVGTEKATHEDLKISSGEGAIGWTALNKKNFFQQDRKEAIGYSPGMKKSSIQSLLAVPVLEHERLEGVLSIESDHPGFFAPDAEAALVSFAAQIAEMIHLSRVAKEREERAVEFQAFYRASKELASMIEFEDIVRKLHILCAEIVHFDFSAVAVPVETGERYSVYQWKGAEENAFVQNDLQNDNHTWISWFLNSREEPFIVSESQLKLQEMPFLSDADDLSGLGTFLAVPLRHQQKNIGVLVLGSHQKEAFTSHQSRIISILCNQAAVSLENSAIIAKMEELAITDGLTGLFNHRFFQESLQRELERAERQNQHLALLILDIDHFKGFNDNFGHPAGDFVLKSLAQILQSNARKIDILARYGGEEFAALLPGIDFKNARKTAERWRKAIQRASLKWEGKSFAITVSMGFATYPEDGSSKVELIEVADRGLYEAKEMGRNQVRHISES